MVEVLINQEITLKYLPTQLSKELKQILTIKNPDYEKKKRLGFYAHSTPKILNIYVENDNSLIIPYGMKQRVLRALDTRGILYRVIDKTAKKDIIPLYKGEVELYDYQERVLRVLNNHSNGLFIAPTGSGKTLTALHLIRDLKQKTLWITHTHDLLMQSKKVAQVLYDNKIGTITEGKVNIQDITFATVQTLSKIDLLKYQDEWGLIIVDEVHKVSGSPNKVMQFYKCLTNLNAHYKFGMTATLYDKPNDTSSTPIYLIGEKLEEITHEEANKLKASHIPIILSTPTSDSYLNADKTMDYAKLVNYLVYYYERSLEIVNELLKHSNHYNIVLSNRNDHLDIIKGLLDEKDLSSRIVTGDVKSKDREIIYDEFNKGKVQYLLSNYQLLKEGKDLPIADRLHLIFPMTEKKTIVQSVGRIERQYKDKEPIVLDYVDSNIGYCYNAYTVRRRILKWQDNKPKQEL